MSLDLATRDGVAILTIDRRDAMNALNFSLIEEFLRSWTMCRGCRFAGC